MNKIKRYVTMAVAGIMMFSLAGCNMIERTPESKRKVVLAKVNNEKITRGDLDDSMKSTLEYLKTQYGEDFETNEDIKEDLKSAREEELDFMVLRALLVQYGKDNNLLMTDEEVKKKLDEQIQALIKVAGSKEAYEKEIKSSYGMTVEEYEAFLKEIVIASDVNDKLREEVSKDVTVSDEEISEYYEKNKASKYTTKAGADTYNILLDSEEKAKEVRAQIKNLDDFKKQADTYNTDSTKGKGGYLGWVEYENSGMVEEFDAAFKKLKNGEISQPVKSKFGWHLITVANVQGEEKVKTLEEVKKEVSEAIKSEKVTEAYNKKIEELKKEYNVKTYTDRF
ncbi:MAG: peptidylprolyl isomerase [Clostridium paraputrificum]